MSDLSMYELDDIIWDDFDRGDDHIVPHSTNARTSKTSIVGDSWKKPRRESPVLSNFNASNTIYQEKSERDTKPFDKKNNMMEKEGDDNSYNYCENVYNCEGKESGDLLYYGWPDDIGNFEDVDKMLRSCDSSFGLGVTDNDDELGWFTSNQIGGNEETLKMDFKIPCHEPCGLNNILPNEMESSGDISFEGSDKKQGFKPIFIGSENDVGVDQKGMKTEISSLNVPESSSISTELNEISLEATSFRQLQQVMEQLDMRTKLCIRDSLYRLARSAEQRHNNQSTDINDIGGPLIAERTSTGLMDMETDTNPIDRSVAHLLFHRPSESRNLAGPLTLKHGSMVGEKLVCEEESNDKGK